MSKKIRIIFADDIELDREILATALKTLAPEFEVITHCEVATLLGRLLKFRPPPRLLILDRSFSENQKKTVSYQADAFDLALRIRDEYPQLDGMAILIFSRKDTAKGAAATSNKYKSKGIWNRPKDTDYSLLVDHIRNTILVQWPPPKP